MWIVPFPKGHLDGFPWQRGWLWHRLYDYGDYKSKGDSNAYNAWTKGMNCMMSPLVTRSFWNMTPNWRHSWCWFRKQPKWKSKVHLMPWIIVSHPPLVTTPNWCGEKCVVKTSWNWRYKTRFVNQYNISLMAMGRTPPEGLVMAKRWATLRICAIRRGMWLCAIWKQSWNNCGNRLIKFSGWK
jgi:hypothetical protein